MREPNRLPFLVAALAAGLLATLGVAWACTLFSPASPFEFSTVAGERPDWPRQAPTSWPAPTIAYRIHGVGWDATNASYIDATMANPNQVRQYANMRYVRAGWPCRALKALECKAAVYTAEHAEGVAIQPLSESHGAWHAPWSFRQLPDVKPLPLPIGILYFGLAANSTFYGGLIWLLLHGFYSLRRRYRKRRNRCPACAYPLTSSVCPECGRSVA